MIQLFHQHAKPPVRSADRRTETRAERAGFARAKKAEKQYARGLRGIASEIGRMARMFPKPEQEFLLRDVLEKYAHALRPWAKAASAKMLADVTRRDESAWKSHGQEIGRQLHLELKNAPTGELLHRMMEENVDLITSLPREAAQRVHHFVLEGMSGGIRADEVSRRILESGHVAKGRANLIARTEVSRASSGLVQARALHLGSEGYIWRTSEDADVRKEHKILNGTFHRWDEPPIAGTNGERAHAGQIYNCRCYPEPVLREES